MVFMGRHCLSVYSVDANPVITRFSLTNRNCFLFFLSLFLSSGGGFERTVNHFTFAQYILSGIIQY